jgi:hypothetical protein
MAKNIYKIRKELFITSDEEIKEGVDQWYLDKFKKTYLGERVSFNSDIGKSFELGAKWQKEQDKKMYSEEEVLVKLYECLGHFAYQHNIVINGNEIDKWFEQFKNK